MKGKSLMDRMTEVVGGAFSGYSDSLNARAGILSRTGNVSFIAKNPKGFLNNKPEVLKNNSAYMNAYKMAPVIDVTMAGLGVMGLLNDD